MSSRVHLLATRRTLPNPPVRRQIRQIGPRRIRIGFVVHVMQVAGAEVLTRELIHRLEHCIEPTVICLDSVGQLGEELLAEGVEVVSLGRKPGRDWRLAIRMARLIRERRLDVVHAHQYTPFFYSAVAKLFHPGFRLMITEHGRHYPDRVFPLRRALNRLLFDRLADSVTACSRFSAEGLRKADGFSGSRIQVIENGVGIDEYGLTWNRAASKRKVGLNPDRKYLIHAARHHPVKDQVTLLGGFALAAADLPNIDLLMVGDGVLRNDLERLAEELQISHRVKFLGVRSDVPDLMRASDAFVLSSLSEAASLTLIEAMATGLPSVITDVGGNPEIARHEREALLYPRRDREGLASALRRVFSDASLARQLGTAARHRAEERYQLDDTIEDYYRTYCRLMNWLPK